MKTLALSPFRDSNPFKPDFGNPEAADHGRPGQSKRRSLQSGYLELPDVLSGVPGGPNVSMRKASPPPKPPRGDTPLFDGTSGDPLRTIALTNLPRPVRAVAPPPFPCRTGGAPRDTMLARFHDDHRRGMQSLKKKATEIAKLNLFIDFDESISNAGAILGYVYQIIKEKGSSLDEIFKKIQGVARAPNPLEYYGAATLATGDLSYYISLCTHAAITPLTLMPLKAGVSGAASAFGRRRAISAERGGFERQRRLLENFASDLEGEGRDSFYPRRLAATAGRRIEELGFAASQNVLGLGFALWTIASAFTIEGKSGISYGYQRHTWRNMDHLSPGDRDAANYAGLAANLCATASVALLVMMARTMDAKNRGAVQGIGERRAILEADGRDDEMDRFAAAHLDAAEAYLRPDLPRGDMSAARHLLARGADALKFRFHGDFGKENRQLKLASQSLLFFSALNLAAGLGQRMELPLLSNFRVLEAGFIMGSANAIYASAKSLSCYVYGHHGQQDREEWVGGDFPLLDRSFQMLTDATGRDGTALRDKIRSNIEADAALRGDVFEMTEGRVGDRKELKSRLRDKNGLGDNLRWLAKFMDNRISVLEAALEARRAVQADMDGADGLHATDGMPPPRLEILESLKESAASGVSDAGAMLDRARQVRNAMVDQKHGDILALQGAAHEFLRVQGHEPESEPPLFLSDTLEALARFVDPHQAGHADEDRLGILAEAHISARAVAAPARDLTRFAASDMIGRAF